MTAYKMPIVTKSDLKGLAKVTFNTGHTKVKIDFANPEVYGKSIVLDADSIPANLNVSGEFFVTVNSEKTEVRNWRPANALVKVKVQKFVSKKDAKPTPMTNPAYGNRYFQVIFEIVEPKEYAGCTIPNTFQYFFLEVYDEDSGKSFTGLENHPKSKYMKPLVAFLTATGAIDKPIPYSDNILPVLERRIKNANKVLMATIKDGWIDGDSISSPEKMTPKEEPDLDDGGDDSDTEDTTEEGDNNLNWEE